MIKITDTNDGIRVEGEEVSRHYPYTGILVIPKNSTLVILDDASEMVVFKSSANYDTWFTGILGSILIEDEIVTRENIIEKFNAISNVLPSGGSGGNVDLSNYYTKEEVDYLISTVDGEGGVGCCATILNNQSNIISMLESLTNDKVLINNMLDAINNEKLNCNYPEETLLNEIIDEEITC